MSDLLPSERDFPELLDVECDFADDDVSVIVCPISLDGEIFPEPLDVDYDAFDHDSVAICPIPLEDEIKGLERLDKCDSPDRADRGGAGHGEADGLSDAEKAAGITTADYIDAKPFLDDYLKRSPRELFFTMVNLTYGPRWQYPLARAKVRSQGHLNAIAHGRTVTDNLIQKTLLISLAQIRQDEERLARAKAVIIETLGR
ncbi:hypothetical protein RAD16_32485 [Bradyrhizobium sp. 18BD]